MSRFKGSRARILAAMAFLLGSALLLSCQPAQPAATPKPAEGAGPVATSAKPAATTAAPEPTKPAAKAVEKPARGGILRIANNADFSSLDPNVMTGQDGFYSIYEQLVEPDKDGNPTKEGLAKDWTFGSDGKSITFKLREAVKFHDGTEFNAAAVKSNVERMQDPATRSAFQDYFFTVASVEVVDPLTVRFNLKQPNVLLLPRMAGGAGGMMVSPAAVKKYGQDFPRNPVGTGPFQFVEWLPGDHMTVKRFEGYWKKDQDGNQLPYLDGAVYKIIPDASTIVANLRTGQIDLAFKQGGIPASMEPLLLSDPNLTLVARMYSVSGVAINTKRAPFDNKALRQAVALAVDREGLASATGLTAWASIVASNEKAVYDDGKSGVFPARDLAKAKAKMAEAGYPSGGLKVTYTSSNSANAVKTAEILKANLAEIGIEVGIETLASSAWNSKVRNESNYQLSSGGTGISIGDPGQYLTQYWHSKGSRNFYGPYSNSRFDEAVDKALVTYDQKARVALYSEAFKAMVEDVPFVPIDVGRNAAVMNKKVRNFVPFWDSWSLRAPDIWLAQ